MLNQASLPYGMSAHAPRTLKRGGRFPYTCLGCNQHFTNGSRRNQNVCGKRECERQRERIYTKNQALAAANGSTQILTDARADQYWREKYADTEQRHHYDGLTPDQIKSRAAKAAMRQAELKAEFARLEGKRC